RERREKVALDGALQGARAEVCGEALLQKELDGRLVPLDRPLPRAEAAPREHVVQLFPQKVAHDAAPQGAEDDDAVNAVDELAPECARDGALHRACGELRFLRETYRSAVRKRRAEVRGHDDDRV